MQTTEILVIGAGVIGNSIAYHLARQGRQVLVVDPEGGHWVKFVVTQVPVSPEKPH